MIQCQFQLKEKEIKFYNREPNTYEIAVKYIDDDGVEGDIYTFRIVIKNIKRYFYVKDHLGSIRQTIDEDGKTVSSQDYSPFGEIIRSYNNAQVNDKYKFTEKERDVETNLDYFGARYYDSEICRWLSIDPMADKYPGWSPYSYCLDNPVNNFDPDGKIVVPKDGNYNSDFWKKYEQAKAYLHKYGADKEIMQLENSKRTYYLENSSTSSFSTLPGVPVIYWNPDQKLTNSFKYYKGVSAFVSCLSAAIVLVHEASHATRLDDILNEKDPNKKKELLKKYEEYRKKNRCSRKNKRS